MENVGKRLKAFRKQKGLTLRKLAKLAGISHSFIADIEAGRGNPSLETLTVLAGALGISVAELVNNTGASLFRNQHTPEQLLREAGAFSADEVNQVPIPVYGVIRAGAPLVAYEDFQGYVLAEREKADFALRVQGDSMDDANIPPGSLVLVKKQDWLEYGDIGVIWVRDEDGVTIKRYLSQDGLVILQPESKSPRHKAKAYRQDEIRILGKVVEIRWETT